MTKPTPFSYTFTVPPEAIDVYGHVNNVIYVQWMQEAGERHPASIPAYRMPDGTAWFAREHRIEYLHPAYLGDDIEVRTWIADCRRVKVLRRYEFVRSSDGKVLARGESQWIFVDLKDGRPSSIPLEIQQLFPIIPDSSPHNEVSK